MSQRYFYGWNVVAATFVMGLFSFGLGFYDVTVYGPPARTWWHTLPRFLGNAWVNERG
jgi:hypothetical protein